MIDDASVKGPVSILAHLTALNNDYLMLNILLKNIRSVLNTLTNNGKSSDSISSAKNFIYRKPLVLPHCGTHVQRGWLDMSFGHMRCCVG